MSWFFFNFLIRSHLISMAPVSFQTSRYRSFNYLNSAHVLLPNCKGTDFGFCLVFKLYSKSLTRNMIVWCLVLFFTAPRWKEDGIFLRLALVILSGFFFFFSPPPSFSLSRYVWWSRIKQCSWYRNCNSVLKLRFTWKMSAIQVVAASTWDESMALCNT